MSISNPLQGVAMVTRTVNTLITIDGQQRCQFLIGTSRRNVVLLGTRSVRRQR